MSRFTRRLPFAALMASLAALAVPAMLPAHADTAPTIPAPVADESGAMPAKETVVLAGGCFWGVQGVFQHVQGVTDAVSGYAGGSKANAEYETVSTGTTGHAESVQVTFDPHKISYGRILQIYFSVAHDPTELNRQGPDTGTQYRSAIFPQTEEQARVANAYISQLGSSHAFSQPIVTKIEPGKMFFPAESYHQDFLTTHPNYPYIVFNDLPKIKELQRLYPDLYRVTPVLVSSQPVTSQSASAAR